jgi:hypothetical protein
LLARTANNSLSISAPDAPDINTTFEFVSTSSPQISSQPDLNLSFQFDASISSKQINPLGELQNNMDEIIKTFCGLQMKHKDMNAVFDQCEKLVKSSFNFMNCLLRSSYANKPCEAINLTTEIILENLQKHRSQYKRDKIYKGMKNIRKD